MRLIDEKINGLGDQPCTGAGTSVVILALNQNLKCLKKVGFIQMLRIIKEIL